MAAPKMSHANTRPESRLLALPDELIHLIMDHLDPAALVCAEFELICRRLRTCVLYSYRTTYETESRPRPSQSDNECINYRSLLIEKYAIDEPNPAKTIINFLLRDYYASSDESLADIARESRLILQNVSDCRSREFQEAAATSFMALGLYSKAQKQYERLIETDHKLPERTVLSAARWGWPFKTIALPRPASTETLQQALVGAATTGDVSRLEHLQSLGAGLPFACKDVAASAARHGKTRVLEWLASQKIKLDGTVGSDSLWEAAKHGHLSSARFLLKQGAKPNRVLDSRGSSPIDIAASVGDVDMLRFLHPYAPTYWDSKSLADHIRCSHACVVTFFLEEVVVDVNEILDGGLAPLHIAMECNRMALAEYIVAHGGDIRKIDRSGQTPIERAQSHGHRVPPSIASDSGDPQEIIHYKILRSKEIIATLSETVLECTVMHWCDRIDGLDFNQKLSSVRNQWSSSNIEEKLSNLWARAFSKTALDWYHNSMIGSDSETILKCIHLTAAQFQTGRFQTPIETSGPCPPGSDHKYKARYLVEKLLPLTSQTSGDELIDAIASGIGDSDLVEAYESFSSPEARLFLGGVQAKSLEEALIMGDFIALCT